MRRRRKDKHRTDTADIVLEAECLLAGRSLETSALRTRRVPTWALLGILAHRDHEGLLRLRTQAMARHPASWEATLGYLPTELLAHAPSERALLQVQREALIPLQLRLLNRDSFNSETATPTSLASLVLEALHRHRSHLDG